MPVFVDNWRRSPRLRTPVLHAMGTFLLSEIGAANAELSLVTMGDASIQELNAEHRGLNQSTDVLSFSQLELKDSKGVHKVLGYEGMLGDIVISMEYAERQAKSYGADLTQETFRLLVHGLCHLLGHDHVHGGAQAAQMTKAEKVLLVAAHTFEPSWVFQR